jgi:DNA-binding transcriptional MerR regulator
MTKQLALAEDWVPRDVLIKDFVVRHHRTLTFIGALVVFVTFVVKDGLREQLKDLVSSISTAESVFAIRNDTSTTTMWLQRLQEQVDWVAEKIKLKGTSFSGDMVEKLHSSLEITNEMHESLGVSLENISTLIEKVPGQLQHKKQYEELEVKLKELREKHDALLQVFTREPMAITWTIAPLLSETQAASDDTRSLAKDVLSAATGARKRREAVVNAATWLSYLLYTLGWGLSLVGRLYGAEDLSVSE